MSHQLLNSPMESYSIPDDLIIEIMIRLPVKSLIRFKTLNKRWRELISSSHFASRNYDFTKNKPLSSYIRMSQVRMQLFTDGHHAAYLRRSFLEKKYTYFLRSVTSIGSSSKGLLCLPYQQSFTIWNPATGDYRDLPYLSDRSLVGFDTRSCGDYRVVALMIIGREFEAKMFSRDSTYWKRISTVVGPEAMACSSVSEVVSLDGCMYWRTYAQNATDGKLCQNVACFDMWELKYKFINGPPSGRCNGRFGVVNGGSLGFFFPAEVEGTLDGWVMNVHDQSWTKRYSIVPFTPIQFKSVEDDVDMIILDKKLHFYDHATKQFGSFPDLPRYVDVIQYKETVFPVCNPP